MFLGHNNNRSQFNDMGSVHGFIGWGVGMLVGLAEFIAIVVYIPELSIFGAVLLSGFTAIGVMFVVAKIFGRTARRQAERANREHRTMRESETQRQIDEMRRANSNIPDVARKDR
jgi:hypothetical protein